MTTEEIEKAAEEYANKHFSSKDIEMYQLSGKQVSRIIKTTFASGVEFSDKHWQERTRWKSLEKEPPKFEDQKYQILVRHSPNIRDVACIIGLRSVEKLIAAGYKDWKEIE